MSKMTWDAFKKTSEYKLWEDLFRVAKEYSINEDTYFKKTDLSGEYWEPFFDRLYKMGSMLGFTKKLKEIRIDWMRPILYFGAQSTGVIEFDGRRDEINKGAISNAILVKFSFKSVINAIHNFANLNDKNFHKEYISFKKDIKYYFLQLAKFVKDGFLIMHNHVKLILKPLLDLRRGAYRLFSLEQMEKNNRHLTIFNDKQDLTIFLNSTKDFFEFERYKQSKDPEGEKLDKFINQNTSQSRLVYEFSKEIRKEPNQGTVNPFATNTAFPKDLESIENKRYKTIEKKNFNNKIKSRKIKEKNNDENKYRLVFFPNIVNINQPQPTRLKHEAYQLLFENGLNSMIDYLNSHQNKDFPYIIDAHKIFVNINYVPNGTKEPATAFYINTLREYIEQLKEKCYEMKLNGLSRVLMPITENVELIKIIKNIFDYHVIIDNVMGNYLLYDQYMFIYDSLHFLTTTNFSEQFEILKNRDFMEECVPRYVIYNFINHSAGVLNKMRLHYKEHEGRPFKFEDSYQITQHDLMNEDNELIFAYEIYGSFKKFFNDAIKEKKKKYDEEVKKFGRFWISEGFFKKEDKPLWLEAIDLLSEINTLVREDIRDYFITMKKREEEEHDNLNLSSSKNNSSFLEQNSNVSGISKTKTAKKGKKQLKPLVKKKSLNKTDTKNKRRRKSSSRKYSTNSLSEQNKLPKDLNNLRPPTVWNFPVHRIEKIYIDGNKKEIRNVDPTLCYKDGRVDKFLKLFEEIYQNTLKYFMTSSADLWDYFYSKCLKALKISYTTSKELKAEEELKRQIEEELRRQEEEEARKEEERERELERLKIKKKGEGELPQETNDENKENAVNNKEEKKTEEKKIPSAKKRLSSAKPSKEVLKKRGEKKGTSRIQSATKK